MAVDALARRDDAPFPTPRTLGLDGGLRMPKLHELQERRAHVVSEMRSINDKAETEKRDRRALARAAI